MKKILLSTSLLLVIAGCGADLDAPVANQGEIVSGDADFSTYVALGDSLTAGFADGALYVVGQENSLPSILAAQMSAAEGGDFVQPLMDANGGLLLGGTPVQPTRLTLNGFSATGAPDIASIEAAPTVEVTTTLAGPFNNLGIPGAKSFHLVASTYGDVSGVAAGTANPYFARIASAPDATLLGDAATQAPTFFSLWVGNNDVLDYLRQGGVGTVHNTSAGLDPTTYMSGDITHPDVIGGVYTQLLTTLTSNGAKGVVLGLPDPTKIPYYTSVDYNPLPLTAESVAALNAAYEPYNQGLAGAQAASAITAEELAQRTIEFTVGQNPVVILDETLTDLTGLNAALLPMRLTTSEDSIPLPTSSKIGQLLDPANPASGQGTGVPFPDADILTADELANARTANATFNATVQALAAQNGLAFADISGLFNTLIDSGLTYGNTSVNGSFIYGNAFSLDGTHLTPRGNAFLANEVINAINTTYGSTLRPVEPAGYLASGSN